MVIQLQSEKIINLREIAEAVRHWLLSESLNLAIFQHTRAFSSKANLNRLILRKLHLKNLQFSLQFLKRVTQTSKNHPIAFVMIC
jgi:hypothetical protein